MKKYILCTIISIQLFYTTLVCMSALPRQQTSQLMQAAIAYLMQKKLYMHYYPHYMQTIKTIAKK